MLVLCLLGAAFSGRVLAQGAPPSASQPADAFSIHSPYRPFAKTRELVNTFALQVLLVLNYTEQNPPAAAWKTRGVPGVELSRYFEKSVPGGGSRSVEIAVSVSPERGYDIYVYGRKTGPGGQEANPDLPDIQSRFRNLVQTIQAQEKALGPQDLGYQIYHLSYLQTDRVLALLKSLGYTTVEYSQQAGESLYEKIYAPIQNGQWHLPVIIKLIDATKTSLMDPAPITTYRPPQQQTQAYGQTYSAVPDIGGTFLHDVTSGAPQQRLLVVYNKNNPGPMEALLNLLRDKIDRPARQIVIEALVIEINTDKLKTLGLDLRGGKKNYDISFEQNQNGNAQPFTFTFTRPASALSNALYFRNAIQALVTSGEAEILSSPSVLVLDGRQARIQIGQQVPVVKSTATAAGITSSVDYFPVGIVLNLRPRVSEDGSEITMQVETIVSAVSQASNSQGGSSPQVLYAPTVDNRQVQSFVRVADNTPFIIGGLISTDKEKTTAGIPILSNIPLLGLPFHRKVTKNTKKEVIVVLTPHVVPLEEKSFSYVIPKDSKIFDSFDNQLFRNAYRIRDDDVFDLRFIYESQVFQNLLARIRARSDQDPSIKTKEPFAGLLDGRVPGEEILVRRMLWEIVFKTDFTRHISENHIIFFENRPDAPDSSGFRTTFLHQALAARAQKGKNTLVLTFDARNRGTPDHPFVQPKATIGYENLTPQTYISRLMQGNRRQPDGTPDRWTILLSDVKPPGVRGATSLQVLQGILVLKRILALNKTLPLSIKEFRVGRQIIFPTEQDLDQRYHVIDRDVAQFFYQVIQYYPEFEKEFNRRTRRLTERMDAAQR